MEVSRQAITLLLTIAMAVVPLQGSMASDSEKSDTDTHTQHNIKGSDLPDASPSCSQHDHHTGSGITYELPDFGDDKTLQTVSSTPGCSCGDGYCPCCGKVSVPVLPSIYSTIRISSQTELIQTFSLYTGTFVLVKTRPPTFT